MSPRSQRGVTLLEIMIAVAITAIIGVLVMGSFRRVDDARALAEAQDERFTEARVALTRLAAELEQAYLSTHYDGKRFREPPTLFRGKDRGSEDELLFSTMTHARLVRDAKESDQAQVAYTLEADPARPGERALFRREKVHLDEDPERGGVAVVVCEHAASFDVEYWDWKRQEWAREWITNTPDHLNVLPTRVRVRLGVVGTDGKTVQVFETQARVAIIHPLAF